MDKGTDKADHPNDGLLPRTDIWTYPDRSQTSYVLRDNRTNINTFDLRVSGLFWPVSMFAL